MRKIQQLSDDDAREILWAACSRSAKGRSAFRILHNYFAGDWCEHDEPCQECGATVMFCAVAVEDHEAQGYVGVPDEAYSCTGRCADEKAGI